MTIKPPHTPTLEKSQIIAGPLAGQSVRFDAARDAQSVDLAGDGSPALFGYVHNRTHFLNAAGCGRDPIDVWLPDGWDSADCYRHLLNLHRRCAQAAREGHSLGNAELRRLLKMDSE